MISFIITIIIVFFISKINTLNAILDQAKEIDKFKIAKISTLKKELEDIKLEKAELIQELEFLPKNIEELKEQLLLESKEHLKTLHKEQIDFEQLSVHYELINKSYLKLENRYNQLKSKNETLAKENAKLHIQEREKYEKIEMIKEHKGELRQEIELLKDLNKQLKNLGLKSKKISQEIDNR